MEHIVVFAAVIAGLATGTAQLSDNSMLVHLTTGINILHTGRVPHHDPYSFTAHGDNWVVQSWLPEVIYAALWKLGGGHLFIAFNMVLYAAFSGGLAGLARTGHWLRTALIVFLAICFGIAQWTSRPTGFGMLFMLLTVAVVTRKRSPWWLLPIGILWINCHGSWPLGVTWIVVTGIGSYLDRSSDTKRYARYATALAAGALVGGLFSPAGWRILTFPLIPFGSRASAFSAIAEWESPDFKASDATSGLLVLACLLITLIILFRRRPNWASLLSTALFLGLSLVGLRNLPLLGIVLAPALAQGWKYDPAEAGATQRFLRVSSVIGWPGFGALAFLLAIGAAECLVMMNKAPFDLASYPVAPTNWMQSQNLLGGSERVFAPDYVGCYFIYRDSDRANVFLDDRYDMYPAQVAADAHTLGSLNKDPAPVLQKYRFNAVLVQRPSHLAQYLDVDLKWQQAWGDRDWQVFTPAGANT